MSGPYFKGQSPEECGCYFPDVVLLRDDPENKKRILHCINHGQYLRPLGNVREPQIIPNPIPDEEWREAERQRLSSL